MTNENLIDEIINQKVEVILKEKKEQRKWIFEQQLEKELEDNMKANSEKYKCNTHDISTIINIIKIMSNDEYGISIEHTEKILHDVNVAVRNVVKF